MPDILLRKYYAQKFILGQFMAQISFELHSFVCLWMPPNTHTICNTICKQRQWGQLKNAHVKKLNFFFFLLICEDYQKVSIPSSIWAHKSWVHETLCPHEGMKAKLSTSYFLKQLLQLPEPLRSAFPSFCVIRSWRPTESAYDIKSL